MRAGIADALLVNSTACHPQRHKSLQTPLLHEAFRAHRNQAIPFYRPVIAGSNQEEGLERRG